MKAAIHVPDLSLESITNLVHKLPCLALPCRACRAAISARLQPGTEASTAYPSINAALQAVWPLRNGTCVVEGCCFPMPSFYLEQHFLIGQTNEAAECACMSPNKGLSSSLTAW